ncbi:unnamed protein product [Diatraea saccharalis]|nr:unnamed protein product [Diatraea saccharalis]
MIGSQVVIKSEPSKTPSPVARMPSPPRTPCKAPPSPPAVAAHTKPPYSFSCLIFMAIEAAPARALPVKEIYAWIVRHFPYFKHAPQGWKNSVRHNLSLNKCFHKVAAAPGLGKGSLWTVDPQHRASLLQAFGRQPIPPAAPDTPPPAKNAPDPQLFPYLARRLAASPPPAPTADEYLAAASVLTMKYGPAVLDQVRARYMYTVSVLSLKYGPAVFDQIRTRYRYTLSVLTMKYGPAVLDQVRDISILLPCSP